MQNLKQILRLGLISTLVAISVSCQNDLEKIRSIDIEGNLPETSCTNFEIKYYKEGRVNLTVGGKILNKYPKSDDKEAYEEMLDSVHLIFYASNGTVANEMTARYAIRYSESGIMEAKNNVIVFNKKGEKLNTEHLIWDGKKEEIRSNVDVLITKKDQIIRGTGLRSDQYFENYEIFNPRNSQFYINK